MPAAAVLREKRWLHTEATRLALHPAVHLHKAFGESLDAFAGRVVQNYENEHFSSVRNAVPTGANAVRDDTSASRNATPGPPGFHGRPN